MNDKHRLILAAHEILEAERGAKALPVCGVIVQSSKGSGGRDFHNWAIDFSKCGDLAAVGKGGWKYIVDAYLSSEAFTRQQVTVTRRFWRYVRMRRGLYATGMFIVEKMDV